MRKSLHNAVRRVWKASLAVLVALSGSLTNAGRGQPPPDSAPSPLESVLPRLRWNAEKQGPLLIVAPEKAKPIASVPPPNEDGYRLADVAASFDRLTVRCGSLHVLAPAQMSVLNVKNLPQPSPVLALSPHDAFAALVASLTTAQRERLAEPDGLGVLDLTSEQRELWDRMFPPGLRVNRWDKPRTDWPDDGATRSVTVSASARAQIRLRIHQTLDVLLQYESKTDPPFAVTASVQHLTRHDTLQGWIDEWSSRTAPGTVRGHKIRSEVPSALKPGDLPFAWDGFDVPVALKGGETVGELVARVAKICRVELYCDVRYQGESVHAIGGRARAGDVLKAL